MKSRAVTHTTIPAAPGWTHCTPIFDEAGVIDGIYEAPVIAWVVTFDTDCHGEVDTRWAQAVTADESVCSADWGYLKRPDGKYVCQEFDSYDTREQLIASMQEREDRRRPRAQPYPWPTDAEITPE